MKYHNTYRPFVCQLCPRGFMKPSDLRRHLMIHTGAWSHDVWMYPKRNVSPYILLLAETATMLECCGDDLILQPISICAVPVHKTPNASLLQLARLTKFMKKQNIQKIFLTDPLSPAKRYFSEPFAKPFH